MFETVEQYFKQILLLPDNPLKKEWESVFNSMAVHTRCRKPVESLLKRRPNEEAAIEQYRLDNFRAITYGSMNKALDDVYRIINGISYTINAPDNVKDFFRSSLVGAYCDASTNETMVLKMFLESIVLKRMIEDPNGFLICVPTGKGINDSSVKVNPQPKLVLSSQYHYSDQNIFIWEDLEKTPLKNSDNKTVLEGRRFYALTKTEYWTIYQSGSMADPTWLSELIYTHNIDAFPVIIFGGEKNTDGYYESFFKPYLAFGDEAVAVFSDWQAQMVQNMHPIREEFMTECLLTSVDKTSNNIDDKEEQFSGSGSQKFKLTSLGKSPFGTIQRPIPVPGLNTEQLEANIPTIRFISPPVEHAKYSGESWQLLIEKAEQALNIDMTVGVDQSGKAKQLDKESQYSMISKIGTKLFDNAILGYLKFVDCYLNRVSFSKSSVSINKPSTFWVKNELDLIHEISTLKTNNAPSFFMAEATNELSKKRFNGNPVNQKVFDFVSLYDPFFIYTSDEKQSLLLSGGMEKKDFIASLRMYSILQQIVFESTADAFLKMDMSKIKEEFDKRLLAYLPQITPMFNTDGTPVEGVAGSDINTPVDIEAEAKARLKGIVGGVQGILAIQQGVSSGTTTRAAGIATLVEIYGFSEDQAARILGDPTEADV